MKEEIEIGDVVFLKSEKAQLMTVIANALGEVDSVVCAYFLPDGFLRREVIRREALVRYA